MPRWRSCRSGVGLSRLICSVSRSRGNERSVSSRRPANSMPLVSTVVGAAAAQAVRISPMSGEQKGLAAGHEDFADAEFGCFAGDPPHALEAERPPRRLGRRAHAAIVATQVAVEIRVEPQARADGPIGVGFAGASPQRITQRVRPASVVVSISVLRVKRHQASRSAPILASRLMTARRSPGRLRRSAAISSGSRPEAKVLVPASISMLVFVVMGNTIMARTPNPSGDTSCDAPKTIKFT